MAIDAASIGADFESYRGDANLAGGSFGPIVVDTRPLQNLATYTYLYNKTKWEADKQETDAKITQLADLSNIALNNLRGKDKEEVSKQYTDLINYASEYARKTPKNNQERLQQTLDWQTKYGAFKNNYNSGKDRAVTYAKRYSDIMASPKDAKTKDAEIAILDKQFDTTDIGTKISAVQNFKMEATPVPEPTSQTFKSVAIGPNHDVETQFEYYNPTTNSGQVSAAVLGLKKAYPKEGTPEYDALSDSEKDQAKVQSTMDSTGSKLWIDAIEPLNQTIKKYINAEGVFDAKSFEDDNASNITLMNPYNALKRYNDYNRQKYDQAQTGVFNDQGIAIKLPPNLNPEDFKVGFIDFSKGIKPEQLVAAGSFAQYKGDKQIKNVTYTGAENKKKDLSLEWYKAKTGRISATKPSGDAATDAGLTQPALIFGEHINRLKTYFNNNSNNDSFKINYEGTDEITRKALGLEKGKYVVYQKDGTALVNADKNGKGGVPLTIEQQKNNFIVAVKGGSKDEAIIDAKFLGDAETGISNIFGTTSGTAIWNNWGQTPTAKAATATTTEKPVMKNDANYYNTESNVSKIEGDTVTYKDGTVWQFKGNKTVQIK